MKPYLKKQLTAGVFALLGTVSAIHATDTVLETLDATEAGYPSLLFTADAVPALREKVQSGIAAEAYGILLEEADAHLAVATDPFQPGELPFTQDGTSGRAVQRYVWELTLVSCPTNKGLFVAIKMARRQGAANEHIRCDT